MKFFFFFQFTLMMAHWTKLVNCLKAECPNCSVLIPEGRHRCPRACFLFSPFLSIADEAQEAEAIQILTSILNIRESTSNKAPQKTIFVLKILFMLYFLMMNSSKASSPRKAASLKQREKFLWLDSAVLSSCTSFCPQSKPFLQKSSDTHDISPVLSPTAQWKQDCLLPSRGPP